MYHYISEAPPGADVYRRDLSINPENLKEQLAYLRREGFFSITLSQLVYHLTLGQPLPPKPVILTFDDGYRDNYVNAFPLLQRYGLVGTFFLVTGPIDDGNPTYMSWEMVSEMSDAGMDMEPHSQRHFDLRGRSQEFLAAEILTSRAAIELHTGRPARFFAYPSGSYDRAVIAFLKANDFWAAVTTVQGASHSSQQVFELKRVRMRAKTTLDDFIWLLNADW